MKNSMELNFFRKKEKKNCFFFPPLNSTKLGLTFITLILENIGSFLINFFYKLISPFY